MGERLLRSRRLIVSSLIFLLALFAVGCTTTFLEYSGKMANQDSNNHVEPYQGASTDENGAESMWRAVRMPASSQNPVRLTKSGNDNQAMNR